MLYQFFKLQRYIYIVNHIISQASFKRNRETYKIMQFIKFLIIKDTKNTKSYICQKIEILYLKIALRLFYHDKSIHYLNKSIRKLLKYKIYKVNRNKMKNHYIY